MPDTTRRSRWWRSTGNRAGLALALGAILLPIVGVLWAAAEARGAVERQVFEGQQAAIGALLDRVDVAHDAAVRAATGAAERLSLTRAVASGDAVEAGRVLPNVAELAPFRSLCVFGVDGVLLASLPEQSRASSPGPPPDAAVVTGPGVVDDNIDVTVRAPILDGDSVVGQLVATIPFRELAGGDEGLSLGPSIDVTIVNDDATILASVLPESEGKKILAPEALAQIADGRAATSSYYAPRFGYTVLSTFVPSHSGQSWDAFAVSRRSTSLADATALTRRLWIGGIVVIVALLFVVIAATRYFGRAERVLHSTQAEVAERNSDLEAVNAGLATFANAAAHDLRSPLQTIRGFAGLLADTEGDRLTDDGRGAVAAIDRQTLRLTGLVNGLLDYARAGAAPLELRDVDPGELVRDVLDRLAGLREERNVEVYVGVLPTTVTCDPVLFAQVLQNLIANAIQYGDIGHPVVRVDGAETDSSVRIQVSDNGAGVDNDERQHIFEMLTRGTEGARHQGTGIGLAMAQRIVERHHGSLSVTDASGSGACFIVEIPTRRALDDAAR